MPNADPEPPESQPDANRILGASLIAAGVVLGGVQIHGRYPAEVELAVATGLAVAGVYMLARVARDRLRGKPGGLLRPGVAVAGLALAA